MSKIISQVLNETLQQVKKTLISPEGPIHGLWSIYQETPNFVAVESLNTTIDASCSPTL